MNLTVYVYMYIIAVAENRTNRTKPYKRRLGKALRVYGFCYVSKSVKFPKIFV